MFQMIYDYPQPWPKNQPVHIEGEFRYDISVSPDTARRKANGFLAGHVTMMVSAGQPVLVIRERPVWRMPANLSLPKANEMATIGEIDVDTQTGEVVPPSKNEINQMQKLAHAIAAHLAPTPTPAN